MTFEPDTIYIKKKDEAHLKILGEPSIISTMSEFFAFYVPGYQWMPKFRLKMWDGKLRLLERYTNEIYVGLLPHIKEFAKQYNYNIEYLDDQPIDLQEEFSIKEAEDFTKSLKLHAKHGDKFVPIEARDYQINAFRHAVQMKRALLLSPTASGKSLIIYLLIRHYLENTEGKILIVVPTTSLVSQLYSDFGEYSYDDTWDVRNECHMIYQGQSKHTDCRVVISTWQSIYKESKNFFDEFQTILGDEAHSFKANSLMGIMNKAKNAEYRIGTTGTLDGTKTHRLVLEGLFGKVYTVTTTKELMDSDSISGMKINCLMLHYPEEVCKLMKGATYQNEIDFIVEHSGRNRFIRNLALSLKGNTLILFQLVAKHGKPLHADILEKAADGRKIFFVSGKTETEDREEIRRITETENDAIIVASYGTFSTGINIRRLNNVILASPSKSRIRILQSLGRGLRKSEHKDILNLFDLSDVLQYKLHKNHTLKHFIQRVKIYNEEKFEYKMYKVRLK